jgi:hypothetical protein
MKPYYILIIIAGLVLGCSRNSEKKIRKQVTAVTEKYIMSQLTDAKRTAVKDGTITFTNDQKKYVIEPSKIFTGLIDDDQKADALVTLSTYDQQFQTASEQLVILKTDRKFTLAGAIESDMRIISLKDRIITADVPEHSRNNPLFNCQSCWEVVKFQYRKGEFIKTE